MKGGINEVLAAFYKALSTDNVDKRKAESAIRQIVAFCLIGDKANIRLTGYMVEVSWSKLPIVTRLFGYHNLRLNPYAYLGIPYMNNK